jgi:class 3 adenylate cyclase/tetratricopeptide (TPR) repeat protein
MDIAEWLGGLGLEQYAQAFRDNAIDIALLPALNDTHLKELGLPLGHRLKLLQAIAAIGQAAAPVTPEPVEATPTTAPSAERRQLTVMFCDLVGSTALSARLDPEDLRAVIGAYHRCVASVIERTGGFVAKYMGDGVLAYFGYPRADEHDAERAVRAGLALVEAVAGLDTAAGVRLQVRVGIATGLVVVGDLIGEGSAQEQSVVGETPNLAARLQALAEPDMVVIAASTRRLVGDLFEHRDLGAVEVKGIAAPVPAWQVLRASVVESRFEALRGSVLSPLVGRDEELDLLLHRWARAAAGEGQVVLVSGEPGIGKSRLASALAERLRAEPHLRLRYFCSPYHEDSALYPFIDQLGRAAGFGRDEPPAARLEKLGTLLALAVPPDEDVALLADLLSLPASEPRPLPNLSPQRKKERTLEALIRQMEGLARHQPVLMVFEDAHWIDPTSRELLDLMVERLHSLPVLLLVAFRPEFQPPWTGRPHVTMLALSRISGSHGAGLVQSLAGNAALASDVIEEIVERADGVPLFIEELTKAVVEAGAERGAEALSSVPASSHAVPATLYAPLLARLDRLGSAAKQVAQTGAAIGRNFSWGLLAAVAELPADALADAVDRLVAAGLVFERGLPPASEYLFKHALVQDTAYNTLLRGPRRQLHARIAHVLENRYPEVAQIQPELLAHHLTQGGELGKAVTYWLVSAQKASQRSANAEALRHVDHGLELVAAMPDNADSRRQEIRLLTTRGVVLRIARGYGSDELLSVLERARNLCQRYGDSRQMFQILSGMWAAQAGRGNWLGCRALAQEALAIAQAEGEATMLMEAHRLLGSASVYLAEHAIAECHLKQAIALYDPREHRGHAVLYGYDAGATSNGYLSWPLLLQGKVGEALAASATSIRLATDLQHAPSLALAYGWATFLHLCTQDTDALSRLAPKLVALCEESGLPHWRALGKIGQGWALARTGEPANGLPLLRSGIEEFRALWGGFLISAFLVCLSDAFRLNRQFVDATAALDQSIDMIERFNERIWEAENYRLRGEIARDEGDLQAAQAAFDTAVAIARKQGTRMFELRAAMGLARLRRDQDRHVEAHDLLAPLYGGFTEGFEMPDLKQAKALLAELAA